MLEYILGAGQARFPLSTVDKLQNPHFWRNLNYFTELIVQTDAFIAQLSASNSWSEDMTFLMQLTGIAVYSGMAILAAIRTSPGTLERIV